MQYQEFGSDQKETVVLLHGGGLSWWNYREEAQLLQNEFHVVLPILDGHAGSDRPFTTIEDNAAEIISWIDEKKGGSVLFMGGLSLGAQILLEILSRRGSICSCALVESAAVIPSAAEKAMIGPAIRSSYGLIRNRRFARLQFRSLHMREELFEDYYRDTCRIGRDDMIAFLQENAAYSLKETLSAVTAQLQVCVGERETGRMRKSAEKICSMVPSAQMHCLPGLYHGEYSLNHANAYAETVRTMTGRKPGQNEK
jgi:pimeloyl-ACP methyl ester carboxylesterase